jgi:hypothetical protein
MRLTQPVARLSEATQMPSPSPSSPWHVLLDSFDEALKRVPDLVELLDQWLQTWTETQRSQLRLRIATRPGVRENAALEEMLGNHWRSDEVILRDMAPLTRDDVLGAARARGVPDPDGFAAGLQERGLVPVTSIPIPLTTLLDRAADGYQLPATAEEVYRLACEQLCAEANLAREGPEGLGLQEVMGAAAHLAQRLLCLAARYRLHGGGDIDEPHRAARRGGQRIGQGPVSAEFEDGGFTALPPLRAANVVSVLVGGAGLGDQVDQAVLTWAASPDLPAAAWRKRGGQHSREGDAGVPDGAGEQLLARVLIDSADYAIIVSVA